MLLCICFQSKTCFLLNIHRGHTMLHSVCQQLESTVCLWMAPHFQTSANGKCFSRTQTSMCYCTFSFCHGVTMSDVRVASLYCVVDCLPTSGGGLVCGWGATLSDISIYMENISQLDNNVMHQHQNSKFSIVH